MKKSISFIPHVLALFVSVIFLDSLRYKFTNHENTQVIFKKLDAWAGTLGFEGAFATSGVFSQYVIGSAELLAAALLLMGIVPALRKLQGFGALLAFVIMSGAVFFHLFTPLGTDPNNDGGGLFIAAVVVWLSSLILVVVHRRSLISLVRPPKRVV